MKTKIPFFAKKGGVNMGYFVVEIKGGLKFECGNS